MVNAPYASRQRRTSITLIITFLLGICIGFALFYALADAAGWNFGESGPVPPPAERQAVKVPAPEKDAGKPTPPSGAPAEQAATTPPEAPATGQEEPEPGPESAAEVADVPGYWPARHLFVGISGTELSPDTGELLATFKPGGVVLRAENLQDAAQTRALVYSIKEAAGLGAGFAAEPYIAVAQDGGQDGNPLGLEDAPAPAELGLADDTARVREAAAAYARAAAARGISVLLAPPLDVLEPNRAANGFAVQAFSNDPVKAATLGLPFIAAAREQGVICVAKHYPGMGTAEAHESGGYVLPETEVGQLARLMYPFSEAARAAAGILVSHVAVPGIDKQRPMRPASLSPVLVNTILRGKWEYGGVILADDVTLGAPVVRAGSEGAADFQVLAPEEAVVGALAAGCDAVLFLNASRKNVAAACTAVRDALDAGVLDPDALAESKARLAAWAEQLPERPVEAPAPPEERPAETEAPQPALAEEEREETPAIPETAEGEEEAAGQDAQETVEPAEEAEEEPEPGMEEAPAQEAAGVEEGEVDGEGPGEGETPEEGDAVNEESEGEAQEAEVPEEGEAVEGEAAVQEGEPASPEGEEAAPEEEAGTDAEPAAKEESTETAEAGVAPGPVSKSQPPDTLVLLHTIGDEETLEDIAAHYGVNVAALRAWNELEGTEVKRGQKISVYVPEDSEFADEAKASQPPKPAYETYVVKRGDNLNRIAGRFGTTRAKLLELNDIPNPNLLFVGLKLKVPRKDSES